MTYKELKSLIPSGEWKHCGTAWSGHAPFAMWLIKTFKPSNIVELGTHGGYSYFTFCEAVEKFNPECRCWAIDTWEGDSHAGFYSGEIYNEVSRINENRFSKFSTLLRKRFDEAADEFEAESIDLLHIDGRHTYEDVKEDFEAYKEKLSSKAIVLFHDTVSNNPDFGVSSFFKEVSELYPSINFKHSSGLGVIFYNKNHSQVEELCRIDSTLFKKLERAGKLARDRFHFKYPNKKIGLAVTLYRNARIHMKDVVYAFLSRD